MTGTYVGIPYFLVAGALIASNGWLDVLLFATTRHTVIFDRPVDSDDTGIDTFAFMRTPHTRVYGNMVWVQGGANTTITAKDDALEERGGPRGRRRKGSTGWEMIGERIGWGANNPRKGRHHPYKGTSRDWVSDGPSSMSQESLRSRGYTTENGIQMDTVTTVVVEHGKSQSRSRAESTFSGEDSDKTVEPQARRSL
ncbi:hypothetical protein SLS62_005534 [Diatrype stigma]|uniref:Uncharacterized protein n=1 Tax=Diatrype stigma TaxID=117547 RepID=A0AAN9USN2_9PEZI